jgi:uncharacterized protein
MADESASVNVTRNEQKEQWEAHAAGDMGVLTYSEQDGKLFLLHTEVPEALEGQGIAGRLVRTALDYAREKGEKVVPFCPFARSWIQRHQEYADLVAEEG